MFDSSFYKKICVCYVLCISFSPGFSQHYENGFARYSQENGLSNNNITDIKQDKQGYLWISTLKGLNRYNGTDFLQFHSDSSTTSLPVEAITKLQWLDEYRLAAITSGGLHIVDTRTYNTSNIIIPAGELKYGYKVNSLMAALGNKEGDVFILTKSGLYHFNQSGQLIFRFDYYKKEQVETHAFGFGNNMLWMNENLLLIVAIDGLYSYEISTRKIKKLNKDNYPLLSEILRNPSQYSIRLVKPGSLLAVDNYSDTILYIDVKRNLTVSSKVPINPLNKEIRFRSDLFRVNDTLFYLTGFSNGFFKLVLNPVTGKIILEPEKYLTSYFCSSIFKDRENRLWIGTNNGLLKEENKKIFVQSVEIPPDTINSALPPSILQLFVHNNKIYAASRRQGGLLVFDKTSLKLLQRISFKEFFPASANVFSVGHSNSDTLLIGTNGPLFWLKTSTGKTGEFPLEDWDRIHAWVSAQFRDSYGNTWIASSSGNIYYYSKSEQTITRVEVDQSLLEKINAPVHINEDAERNIWFGGHGICRFNTKTRKFDQLLDSFPYVRFPRKEIDALVTDKRNTLWLANAFNGIIGYNLYTKAWQHFTTDNGLPDNTSTALQIVKDKLWIACPTGIACLDLLTNKIAAFNKNDGFPGITVTGNRFFYDPTSNHLYIGFDNHLVRFNPDSLIQETNAPVFFIESLTLSGDRIQFYPPDTITAPYFNNNFSVTIGSINYNDIQDQRFVYRLINNKDSSWKILSGQPLINFNNLAPGSYQLQVKLNSINQRWPEQMKMLTVIIKPPFWQTWWFRLLGILLIGVIIFWVTRQRIKNIRKKATIDKQLAEMEMKGLHAQMNPHFIFNALNSIKDMILHDEKKNASRYLSKFAQLIRLNLEHSQQTFITLRENIEYLEHYLNMEQLRFGDLHYEIKIDSSLKTNITLLPPMLLQPLVENAIWHGLLPKQGEKRVEIRFQKKNEALVCEIEDNGIGINTSLENKTQKLNRSVGIENIRHRMKVLNEKYKLNYLLTIKDKKEITALSESGTIAILALPLNHTL